MKYKILLGFLISGWSAIAQVVDPFVVENSTDQEQWVQSRLDKMSIDEKIGQLFMLNVYSDDRTDKSGVRKMIRKYHIGGLIFFQGTPQKQAELYNYYQTKSDIPLLIGFDGEWGLDMRLENTFKYPFNMTLGAVEDNDLIEQFGYQIGFHHKRIGVQINFAPVVDINTNPKNPIIGNRSFGENPVRVTEKAKYFIRGMQSAGVMANAKHFPGHGDTSTDSHKALPFLDFDRERLDAVELYPYKELVKTDLASVMVGHLEVPALVEEKGLPTSLSYSVVTKLLQEELGFQGLVFTDALNMKGAANYGELGAVDLKAFLAGNDMLLYSNDIASGFKTLKKAYKKGVFDEERLDRSVRKILRAKYWAGLNAKSSVEINGISQDIHTEKDDLLLEKLYDAAITLVKNKELPYEDLSEKTAYIHLGDASGDAFYNALSFYQKVDQIDGLSPDLEIQIKKYDRVIIGYHKSDDKFWRSFDFSETEKGVIQKVSKSNATTLVAFTSPYALMQLEDMSDLNQVVVAYQNANVAQRLAAEKLFGARAFKGTLPVGIDSQFHEGHGLKTMAVERLGFTTPLGVGVDAKKLDEVDRLMRVVIDSSMAPGLVVLAARDGKVFYHKSMGYHTYEKEQPTEQDDIFDLASVTKIIGGLPMLMKGYQANRFALDDNLGSHFPQLKGSNKDTVSVREALAHVGRLQAWIPYYKSTIDSTTSLPLERYYKKEQDSVFSIKVANDLYLDASFKDEIYQQIADEDQLKNTGYRYSGLLYYLIGDWVERNYNLSLDRANSSFFYEPLGAYTLGYNPIDSGLDADRVVPSEEDDYFRHQVLKGYVHDMGAAMMGGVNGNAGLFGNAYDVLKMMQMYLQGGSYGGKRYLDASTIRVFNQRYYESDGVRRGLGFDKPALEEGVYASADSASADSFGHSGFTGTFAWADPDTGLVYIFLSNRVYPTMTNNLLGKSNMRTRIHQAFYEALLN